MGTERINYFRAKLYLILIGQSPIFTTWTNHVEQDWVGEEKMDFDKPRYQEPKSLPDFPYLHQNTM